MTAKEVALAEFEKWYAALPAQAGGFPARGTIGAALVVLERLKEHFDLNLDSHRAERGQSQIKGLSGSAVAKILSGFGENRPFLSEGGRTNRGAAGAVGGMLRSLRIANIDKLAAPQRVEVLHSLQGFLVEKVREFHGRQRLKFVFDPAKSTRYAVNRILAAARETGKEGPVAQYLVGAKLQLRFPELLVGNESFSTADQQLGRPGDFVVGDTAFHVTVAPMSAIYEKCKANLESGLRVYLLVPERLVVGTRQNADAVAQGEIAVEAIESFVGQNVEELSTFSKNRLAEGLRRLLETYNRRVNETEADKSMLIEIPPGLLRAASRQ